MRIPILLAVLCASCAMAANVDECACDPRNPDTMQVRQCSLCQEAEKQPAGEPYFFLKDSSPHKPNRWLLLPRNHSADGRTPLSTLAPDQRTALWRAAIARAQELWGSEWGVAMNGDEVRTQCHMHIHLGRIIPGVESGKPLVVKGPEQIPVPKDGTGLWIHAAGKKLHIHTGEQRAETVLYR